MRFTALLIYGRIFLIGAVLFVTSARPITNTGNGHSEEHISESISKEITEIDKDEDYDSNLAGFYDYYPDYDSEPEDDYQYPSDVDDSLKKSSASNEKANRLITTPDVEQVDKNKDVEVEDRITENDIDTFLPIPMPTDFDSYDVNVTDGFITLAELVAVTGARENVELAFKASDINGDGKLTLEEFKRAPLMLQGETPYNIETLANVERQLFTDESTINELVRKLENTDSGSLKIVESLKDNLAEVKQNEEDVAEVIGKKLFDDDFQKIDH